MYRRPLGEPLRLVLLMTWTSLGVIFLLLCPLSSLQADYVILALAPSLQRSINFVPCLPAARETLNQRVPMGCVTKFMIYYDRPYWKEQGECPAVDNNARTNDESNHPHKIFTKFWWPFLLWVPTRLKSEAAVIIIQIYLFNERVTFEYLYFRVWRNSLHFRKESNASTCRCSPGWHKTGREISSFDWVSDKLIFHLWKS